MRIAKAAPPADSHSGSEDDEPPMHLRFKPFFISRSEVGRPRSMKFFSIILACIILSLVLFFAYFGQQNGVSIILQIAALLFFCFGWYMFYKFCRAVQSVEIGYDPMNDTQLIIRQIRCWYFHASCGCFCYCLNWCFTKEKTRTIHESHQITRVIKANIRSISDDSQHKTYVVELQTQNSKIHNDNKNRNKNNNEGNNEGNNNDINNNNNDLNDNEDGFENSDNNPHWKCRLDQFKSSGKAQRLTDDINKHLDKNKKFEVEAMVDYA